MTCWILQSIAWGFAASIISVAYCVVLAMEDNPLNFWFRFLDRTQNITRRVIRQWPIIQWIGKILGACEKCFAGQLALWSSSALIGWELSVTSIGVHVLAASSAVIFATFLSQAYRWSRNRI